MNDQLLPEKSPVQPALLQGRLRLNRPLSGASHWMDIELTNPGPTPGPGQFYMLRGQAWNQLLARPFSLAGCREGGGVLSFLVDGVGRGTRELVGLGEGTEVVLWGPLGNCFPKRPDVVMVAGGVGLAPFLYALGQLGGRLLFGGRQASQVATAKLVPSGHPLSIATDDGSLGYRGSVVDLLAHLVDQGEVNPGAAIYVCGPNPMMAATAKLAAERNLECLVSLETAMGCGLGICSGCAVQVQPAGHDCGEGDTVLTCKQGPIFPAGSVAWSALAGH